MAEGEDKKNQQTNQNDPAQKSGNSANTQKPKNRRRRRPRKKKNPQQPQQTQQPQKPQQNKKDKDESNILGQIQAQPAVEKTPVAKPELVVEDPTLKEVEIKTEIEAPVEETKNNETEEKFLASDDGGKPEPKPTPVPEPVVPPPELPDQAPPADSAGPVGWDQLKNAIKKDHEETVTGEVIPAVVPVDISSEPAPEPAPQEVASPEPEPEVVSEPVPEPIPVTDGSEYLAADDEAEKQEIIRIIVKYALGGCAVIAILAGIFLFNIPGTIYTIASDLLDDGETKQEQVSTQPETKPETKPETSNKTDSDLEDGTGTALISGGQIPKVRKVPAFVQTLFYVGLPEIIASDSDRITTYLQVLNELQNGFETDINQLLDSSANRASTLEVHLRELNGLLAEAQFTYENLNEEADDIKVDFNKVTTQKEILEESFFVALEKLASNESNTILNDFIEVSRKQVVLKAGFNAITKISEMYDIAIRNTKARIKDIEANKQALVKGVKVVDIKGSDLDLIIQDEEL